MTLIKNSFWNILAVVVPALIAIPALGVIARNLGVELFGIFTLIFALIGYAGIFDAGFSRAVVREVAVSNSKPVQIKKILSTALIVISSLSILPSCFLFFYAEELATILSVSEQSSQDVIVSFKILSLVIPVFLATLILFGYYEGVEKFKQLSIIRLVCNGLLSLLPLVAVLITPTIVSAVIGVLVARFLSFFILLFNIRCQLPADKLNYFDLKIFKRLISFGSWITVSNVISPIMVYFDRFILSSYSGAGHVAIYTAPAEIISKMLALPMAFGKALFPYLASRNDKLKSDKFSQQSVGVVLVSTLIIVLPIFIFAEDLILIWLGVSYDDSSVVLRVLLIGFIFNSMAQVPYTKIQASGNSKLTAIIHLFELVPYLLILVLLIERYSYVGAAMAWSLRVMVDFAILYFWASKNES